MLWIFSLTIFVGAALLFLIQPMFARLMLPELGGSPAVWNTAMVFYQAALLAGYAYAHFATTKFGARRQSLLHGVLLFAPLLALPIALNSNFKPPAISSPIPWILGIMTLSVGLPFFVVSATSPLMQRWLAATDHPAARDPYFLYAASNAGSLLALLSYPLVVEPNFTLAAQTRFWSLGYGALLLLLLGCIALLWRAKQAVSIPQAVSTPVTQSPTKGEGIKSAEITPRRRLRWVALAFVPSSLMLSATTYVTTDIAAIPLLWIIPLTLYLLTFIFVFAARPIMPHDLIARALPIALLPLVVVVAAEANHPMTILIALHLLALFVASLACHSALAQDRPSPASLTEFYLWMSVGGVLGGAFNALLAPLIFNDVTEYPLVIILCALLAIPAPHKNTDGDKIFDLAAPVVLGALCAGLILVLQSRGYTSDRWVLGAMFGVPCLIAFAFSRRPLRFAFAIALIFLAANLRQESGAQTLYLQRSFFGILRVERAGSGIYACHRLVHGSTLHGEQSLDPARAREPLTYYARSGPLGQAVAALEKLRGEGFKNIGAVGLGAGTAACYGRENQSWTFYEIDPVVKAIAEDPKYFTYLRECRAPYKIVLGDGRLQLQSAPDNYYDLLILDAYSSDALPVHLLTREALQLYLQKMSPHGAMIFNISNRHLRLEPLMAALAQDLGLSGLVFGDFNLDPKESATGKTVSDWVILTRSKEDLGSLVKNPNWSALQGEPNVRAWTDGYSSLLSVFRWR